MMELIRTEHLSKTYDGGAFPVKAVVDVSVTITRSEFTVLAGPSGSGKTTLLNLLGALDKPTSGTIHFDAENIGEKTPTELASLRLHKIGFIFQAYNLIPVLTAMENIEFTMMLLGTHESERRARAMTVMEELGIRDLASKRPNAMSGGQQQRVAVARAIVTNPAVVLADEPTANLDSDTSRTLLDLMETMNREKGITFLFSSHDPQVIERGRRLLLMKDGRIEKEEKRGE